MWWTCDETSDTQVVCVALVLLLVSLKGKKCAVSFFIWSFMMISLLTYSTHTSIKILLSKVEGSERNHKIYFINVKESIHRMVLDHIVKRLHTK